VEARSSVIGRTLPTGLRRPARSGRDRSVHAVGSGSVSDTHSTQTPGRQFDDGRLDVVAIGNALVDVLAHATDDDLGRLDLVKGSMDAGRPGPGGHGLRGDGSPVSRCRGARPPTPPSGWPPSGAGSGTSGKVADDELRGDLPARHRRRRRGGGPHREGGPSRPPGRTGHRAVSDPGHRGRRADHGDPPGVASALGPEDLDEESRRPGPGGVPGGVPVGPAAGQDGHAAGHGGGPRGRRAGGPHPVGPLLCERHRGSSSSCSTARSTCCSPTRRR
jgi:hypothetical protein